MQNTNADKQNQQIEDFKKRYSHLSKPLYIKRGPRSLRNIGYFRGRKESFVSEKLNLEETGEL